MSKPKIIPIKWQKTAPREFRSFKPRKCQPLDLRLKKVLIETAATPCGCEVRGPRR